MVKLIYGTGNKGKLNLMREYLEGLDLEIIGLDEVDAVLEEPEECGKKPLENARQKAEYYYSVLKQPVFSCDSGLFIEGLSEEEQPGVHVRNVNGKRLTDAEMTAHYRKIAHRLGGKCKAKYVNGICLVLSDTEKYESDGEEIGSEPFFLVEEAVAQRDEGFPLDPISIEPKSGKYFTECNDRGDYGPSRNGFRRFFIESCGLE